MTSSILSNWVHILGCLARLLLICLALKVEFAVAADQPYVSVSDLKEVLRLEEVGRVVETMNNIKRMPYDSLLASFLQELWLEKRVAYPDLPWDIVTDDQVKVEIAEILMQERRNGFIKLDSEPFRRYALILINSSDVVKVWGAIRVLRYIDDERDVEIIVETGVRRGNMGIFRTAVLSLLWMCNDAAAQGLNRMEAKASSSDDYEFIQEMRKEFDALRASGDWCKK